MDRSQRDNCGMLQLNDLPTDLLEEIFLRFVAQSQDHPSSPPSKSNFLSPESPLFLSKICKQWRDISLGFGRLWTHLHVVDPQDVAIVQHLEEWMNRTGSIPLCLSFREDLQYDREASAAVLWLFLNSLHRCRAFEMDVKIGLEHYGLERLERASFTSLETVRVSWDGVEDDNSVILASFLLNTSSLRTIQWSGGMRPLDAVSHTWENLRHLEIDHVTCPVGLFDAFSHCQNLECLKLHVFLTNDHDYDSRFITLPRLTQLSILLGPRHTETLNQLTLPSLEELKLVLAYIQLAWDPVRDLIRRSGVTLRKFSICVASELSCMDSVELVQILKMSEFQELRVLRVEEPIVGADIVKFLTLPSRSDPGVADGDEGSAGYLVHLESIYLVFGYIGMIQTVQGLRELIKSRLGILLEPKLKEYVEMREHIYFSLSISPS